MPVRRTLASAAVGATLAGGVVAAAELTAQPAPRPKLVLDARGPLFDAANLVPGAEVAACATVRNDGDGRGRPLLYVPEVSGSLAAHLRLTVTRGRSAGAGGGSCEGFAADDRRFGADEPGVVFRGRLDAFPASAATALLDPGVWAAGEAHAYRFALELADEAGAEGRASAWNWRLAVEALDSSAPPADPASPVSAAGVGSEAASCRTVRLAGAARGRRNRTLVKIVRLSPRVHGVVVLRVFGASGAPRFVMTTGLRVRGKTLLIPRWARVRYVLNRRHVRVARVRPFRVRVPARALRQGRNSVGVRVQPTRGRARSARFTLTAAPVGASGNGVCVVGL
jgi:hypothetical protein